MKINRKTQMFPSKTTKNFFKTINFFKNSLKPLICFKNSFKNSQSFQKFLRIRYDYI